MSRIVLLTLALSACLFGQSPALLRDAEPPPAKDRAAAQARRVRKGMELRQSRYVGIRQEVLAQETITLNLFPGVELAAKRVGSHWTADGSTQVWYGRIEGMPHGYAALVATGEMVSGNVRTDDGSFYWIRQVDGELHVAEQVESTVADHDDVRQPGTSTDARPQTGAPPPAKPAAVISPERLAAAGSERAIDTTVVYVMGLYTPKAKNEAGGATAILQRIQLGITESNMALLNSNVPMMFHLVHTQEINYSEASGIEDALDRLQSRTDGYMDEVHALRNQWGADLVSLWIDDLDNPASNTAGIAYLMNNVSSDFEAWAFSVVEQYYGPGPQYSFPHELGHNMGSHHDRPNARTPGAFNYSYGYQQTGGPNRYRTIMAYECSGAPCPRAMYFSNPNVLYRGLATGVPSSSSQSADNAQSLTNTREVVAAFRAFGGGGGGGGGGTGPPPTCTYSVSPLSGTVPPAGGNGNITVNTTSACNWTATANQPWLSVLSGASGAGPGTVIYSGTANPTATARSATLSVAGFTYTVNQGPATTGSNVTVTTSPPGLTVIVDGEVYSAPQTFRWQANSLHTIGAATQGNGGIRFRYLNWSDGAAATHTVLTPGGSTTYTANFSVQYLLTTNASPSTAGSISVNPPSPDGYYDFGTEVTLNAGSNAGWHLWNWMGAASGSAPQAVLTMFGPLTATAAYVSSSGGVTISTVPAGLRIVVDGTEVVTPQVYPWTPGSTHTISAIPSQTGTNARYSFTQWSDGGAASHTTTASGAAANYTAHFQPAYRLTKTTQPEGTGTVVEAPGAADGYVPAGSTVHVQSRAVPGFRFQNWTGAVTGTSAVAALLVNGPVSVTANMIPATVPVTLQTTPAGLPLVVDGATVVAPQTFEWLAGSTHSIGAVSPYTVGGTRHTFTSWSDQGAITHSITVPNGGGSYTATFQTQYQLTALANGGTISILPAAAGNWYNPGTTVQVAAQATNGAVFTGWGGDLSGTANPNVVALLGPRTITASFSGSANCTYELDHRGSTAPASGEIRMIRLLTGGACQWGATSATPWITITSGGTGAGNGIVRFRVEPNPDSTMRTGSVNLAGHVYTVTQNAAGCAFTVTGPPAVMPSAGGAYQLTIGTQPGCGWRVVTSSTWITITGNAEGSGPGQVGFTVAANTAAQPRTGMVSVGGQTLPLVQQPPTPASPFTDVATGHPFVDYISLLKTHNVTTGCGSSTTTYCPEEVMTRSEMAVFLVRALLGEGFSFSQTPYFTDTPSTHPRFSYIQKLRELGVTNGCTATTYCPNDPVTRGQMAAFLVRARMGLTATDSIPHTTLPYFADVVPANVFFPHIQKLKELGITGGCSASVYCADDPNTRGQMAVFVIRGFF